jgi:hypothetical protein
MQTADATGAPFSMPVSLCPTDPTWPEEWTSDKELTVSVGEATGSQMQVYYHSKTIAAYS